MLVVKDRAMLGKAMLDSNVEGRIMDHHAATVRVDMGHLVTDLNAMVHHAKDHHITAVLGLNAMDLNVMEDIAHHAMGATVSHVIE